MTAGAVHVALVLPTLAALAGILAAWDPRIAKQDVYQPAWVVLCVASVFVQWTLLGLLKLWRGSEGSRVSVMGALTTVALAGVLFGAGFWLLRSGLDVPTAP